MTADGAWCWREDCDGGRPELNVLVYSNIIPPQNV
jgi:hypothetical protein